MKCKAILEVPDGFTISDCLKCDWAYRDSRNKLIYCILLKTNIDLRTSIRNCPLVEGDNGK